MVFDLYRLPVVPKRSTRIGGRGIRRSRSPFTFPKTVPGGRKLYRFDGRPYEKRLKNYAFGALRTRAIINNSETFGKPSRVHATTPNSSKRVPAERRVYNNGGNPLMFPLKPYGYSSRGVLPSPTPRRPLTTLYGTYYQTPGARN